MVSYTMRKRRKRLLILQLGHRNDGGALFGPGVRMLGPTLDRS
jgi:hypothetical protein